MPYIIFWLYLYFLNILYFFKFSCTNIFHRRSLCTFYKACAQPMSGVVTKLRRLSLAGLKPRISPVNSFKMHMHGFRKMHFTWCFLVGVCSRGLPTGDPSLQPQCCAIFYRQNALLQRDVVVTFCATTGQLVVSPPWYRFNEAWPKWQSLKNVLHEIIFASWFETK